MQRSHSMAGIPFSQRRLSPSSPPLLLLSLLLCRVDLVAGQSDCTVPATLPELNLRPWFCEPIGIRTDTDDRSACLGTGHVLNRTNPGLCRGRWQWYQVSTVHTHTVPYYEIVNLADGSLQHVQQTKTVTGMKHALAFHVQTEFCPHTPDCGTPGNPQAHYTNVDVLAIDGDPVHDWTSPTPLSQPLCPGGTCNNYKQLIDAYYPGAKLGKYRKYFQNRKSVSFTFGFHSGIDVNDTDTGCDATVLQPKVNIGVYCSWVPPAGDMLELPCRYTISAHLIPEEVYDGFDATYPIPPAGLKGYDSHAPEYVRNNPDIDLAADFLPDAASHYFKVKVGGFDVLNVSLERTGPNLTWTDALGRLGTNGHGMKGVVTMRKRSHGCPTRNLHQGRVNVTDMTLGVELPAFCTDEEGAGDLVVGVLADETFGPTYTTLPEAFDGSVGPDGQPMAFGTPGLNTRMQTTYGNYRIRIHHTAYFAGNVSDGEERGACISYGQWRSYYIDTSGEHDAVLEVGLSGAISSTYIRSGVPPTMLPMPLYDVRSPPATMLVTASPCDVSMPTRWHFSLYLAPLAEASSQSLEPTEFSISIKLRAANLSLGDRVVSNYEGGRGYVCCGAMRLFRLPPILEKETLRVNVNVTMGRLQAVLVKWGSCPSMLGDVDGLTGECSAFCHMNWLTTRGQYSGTLYSEALSSLVVPHGHGDAPDKRRAGRWYLGIQAMPDEAAMFSLTASTETPLYVPASQRCDKQTQFCASDPARQSWNHSGPPAPPPSIAALKHARAVARGEIGLMTMEAVQELIANDIAQRVVFIVLMLFTFIVGRWFYRTWRFRRLMRYHLPHDRMDF